MFKKLGYLTIVWAVLCLVNTAGAADGEQSQIDDVQLTLVSTGATIPVPNGDFELLYKPGTAITGNVVVGGWSMGVGPDCPIEDGLYQFSDGTTGTNADIAGWIGYDMDGWVAEGGTYERDITNGNLQGNISLVDDNHRFGANGGDWGNPAGGLIISAASLGTVTNGTYRLSMMAKGNATPVVLNLLADGIPLKPTSSVEPALAVGWQEISKTYDAASLELYVGASLTIVAGVERQAGTSGVNPFVPVSPKPEDDAMDVKSTNRLLRWSSGPGHTAGYWDVYLGTDPDNLLLVADNTPFVSKLVVRAAGFESSQTYYWRVDALDTDKTTIAQGDLWSFFVLPETAGNPSPVDRGKNKLTDVELSWRAGANGDLHHVYFGIDRDAVANADKSSPEYQGRTVGAATLFNPGELERGVTYYWRVDEAKATGAQWQGAVWQFSTLPVLPILDPDLLGWWKLDEGSGNTAIDWSGHDNHGEILYPNGGLGEDGAVWVDDPSKGMILTFNGHDETGALVKAGKIPAIGANDNFTWAFWARQEADGSGEFETILGNRDVGVNHPRFIMFTPTKFEYFLNTGEYVVDHGLVEGLDYPDLEEDVWTHHAIIKEGTSLTYYRDGFETGKDSTTIDQGENALYIGGDLVSGRWSGSMYNVRIYKRALSLEELETAMRRDPAVAWDPMPVRGRVGDIQEAAMLSWKPGDDAIQHDVYFGVDAEAVAFATSEDTTGLYRGRQSSTQFAPDDLQMGQTYYWRIDQVNGDQSLSEGYVWRFTVTPYLIVDDFESYTNFSPDRVFQTWTDGWGFSADDYYPNGKASNGSGSAVGHDIWTGGYPTLVETDNVFAGVQAMPIYYNNTTGSGRSEVDRTFTPGVDWTVGDVTTLVLHLRGEADNTGQLYCKINGTKLAYNGDPADISSLSWKVWEIDLASVGVNLTSITTLTVGIEGGQSGVLFIDDIRLTPDTLVDPGE